MPKQIKIVEQTEMFNPAFEAAIRAETTRTGRLSKLTSGDQYLDLYWSQMGI